MASYGAGKFGRAGDGGAVAVRGFEQIQQGLRQVDRGVQNELRGRFREIGEHVKTAARRNVPHTTGRHGPGPTIESGLKISVLSRGVSIYTTAPHGGAVNVGAWTSDGRGPHISRTKASHYMDRAVQTSQPFVELETQRVIDWVLTTFEKG